MKSVPAASEINVHSVARVNPGAKPAPPSHCNVVYMGGALAKRKCSFISQRGTNPRRSDDLTDQLCNEGGARPARNMEWTFISLAADPNANVIIAEKAEGAGERTGRGGDGECAEWVHRCQGVVKNP